MLSVTDLAGAELPAIIAVVHVPRDHVTVLQPHAQLVGRNHLELTKAAPAALAAAVLALLALQLSVIPAAVAADAVAPTAAAAMSAVAPCSQASS